MGLMHMPGGRVSASLSEIVEHLTRTYCTHIASETQHIEVP